MFYQMLAEFEEDVLSGKLGDCNLKEIHIGILDGATPISQQPYTLPYKPLEPVKKELQSLIDNGIIERSDSSWCSPMVPIRKTNGKIRICIDFRKLNEITPQIQHLILKFEELVEKVGNSQCLTKLDLMKGFHQLVLDEASRPLTTFCSPIGKFRYCKLPFGLRNAPAYFQEAMELALVDCLAFCCIYIDDILFFSSNPEAHVSDVRETLRRLKKHGLTVKKDKCEFGRASLTYLGYTIGAGKISVSEARIKPILEYKKPRTQKHLKSFLGTMNYYRRFIPEFSHVSPRLSHATSTKMPQVIRWAPDMEEAFHLLCSKLANYVIWHVPLPSDKLLSM